MVINYDFGTPSGILPPLPRAGIKPTSRCLSSATSRSFSASWACSAVASSACSPPNAWSPKHPLQPRPQVAQGLDINIGSCRSREIRKITVGSQWANIPLASTLMTQELARKLLAGTRAHRFQAAKSAGRELLELRVMLGSLRAARRVLLMQVQYRHLMLVGGHQI